jgi:hypothetical protein
LRVAVDAAPVVAPFELHNPAARMSGGHENSVKTNFGNTIVSVSDLTSAIDLIDCPSRLADSTVNYRTPLDRLNKMEDVTARMVVLRGDRTRLGLIRPGLGRFMNVMDNNSHCVALALNHDDVVRIEPARKNR